MRVVLKPLGIAIILLTISLLGGIAVYWQSVAFSRKGGVSAQSLDDARRLGNAQGKIGLLTSEVKKPWVDLQRLRVDQANGGKVKIEVQAVGAREALQNILNGQAQPLLWVPDNALWATRLSDAWAERSPRKPLFNPADIQDYRTYLQTPLVFLTKREKEPFLRSRLSGARSWQEIHKLCARDAETPWNRPLRFTFADPVHDDSGFLAVALLLAQYADEKTGGDFARAVKSPEFGVFLKGLAKGYVASPSASAGAAAILAAFRERNAPYDVLCTYESVAIQCAEMNRDLRIIYPSPTIVSEVSVISLTNAPWATPDSVAAAQAVMEILGDEQAIRGGLQLGMRPLRETSDLSLRPILKGLEKQGALQQFATMPNPPYEPVNEALARWAEYVGTPATSAGAK